LQYRKVPESWSWPLSIINIKTHRPANNKTFCSIH